MAIPDISGLSHAEIEALLDAVEARKLVHGDGGRVMPPILRYFAWEHLPGPLRTVSQPFGDLATWVVEHVPDGPERTVALRKLLEAKDAAVRAALG